MKTVFLSFLMILCSSNAALAEKVIYDCGPSPYGSDITLTVQSAKGSFYSHMAIFESPGEDEVSGAFNRFAKMRFEGSKESDEQDGAYFLLHDPKNPTHQIIAEIKKKGEPAEVVELKEVLNKRKKPKKNSYVCTVK